MGEKEYTTAFGYLEKTIGDFFIFMLSDPSNTVAFEQNNDQWIFVVETTPKKLEHIPVPVVLRILSLCQEALGIIARFVFEDNVTFVSRLGSVIWGEIVNSILVTILPHFC